MSKPRIVLLAGWGQTSEVFSELAALLDNEFSVERISVYELTKAWRSSAGELPVPGSSLAPSDHAQQFYDDYLHGHPATILGWSMGGMVALEAAFWFPLAVKQLILPATCTSFCRREGYSAGVPQENVEKLIAGLESDRRQTLAWFLRQVYRKSISEIAFQQKLENAVRLEPVILQNGLTYLRDTDLRGIVGQIRQPALLLHGKQDRVISPEAGMDLQDRLPQVTLHLLEQGTHGLCEQFPAEIASWIRGYTGG